jgi:hypothetical protein
VSFRSILQNRLFLSLSSLTTIICLLYPPIFTYDSAHYLSYQDILSGEKNLEQWDPIRGIVFPLILKLDMAIFGENNNAFLIPLIAALILLFALACYFVIFELNIEDKRYQNLVVALVFVLIVLDPLILGYFHVVLTEYLAATCLALSCLVALKLYLHSNSLEKPDRRFAGYAVYYVLAVPLAYSLKQPYVGAALYPLILITILIIARSPKLKTILTFSMINGIVLVALGLSIAAWNAVLPDAGMAGRADRQVNSFIRKSYLDNLKILQQGGVLSLCKVFAAKYCALSNLCSYDQKKNIISAQFSLSRTCENGIIGYYIFTPERVNLFPVLDKLKPYIKPFAAVSKPPGYLNRLLEALSIKSTLLFSLLYLLLPFIFVMIAIIKLWRYRTSSPYTLLFLCSGSALLNAVVHSIIYFPIDRYLFMGYPLLLVTLIILVSLFARWIRTSWIKRSSIIVQEK